VVRGVCLRGDREIDASEIIRHAPHAIGRAIEDEPTGREEEDAIEQVEYFGGGLRGEREESCAWSAACQHPCGARRAHGQAGYLAPFWRVRARACERERAREGVGRESGRGSASKRVRESVYERETERASVCACAGAWWMVEMTVHPSCARSFRVLTIE